MASGVETTPYGTGARMTQGRVGYNAEPAMTNPGYAAPKEYDIRSGDTPNHLSVAGAINLCNNDIRQLREEFEELRARLSVVLAERDHKNQGRPIAPTHCKVAAEIMLVYNEIQNLRESVQLTIEQLDL